MPSAPDDSRSKDSYSEPARIPDDAGYEQLAELLQIQVGLLERGDLSLAEALAAYERGVELVQRCGEILDGAQLRISTLSSEAEVAMNGEPPVDRDEDDDDEWEASDDDVPF